MSRPTQFRFFNSRMVSLPARKALRFAEILCWLVAAVALSWFLFVSVNAHLFQARELRRFYAAGGNTAPVRPPVPGDVVGKLTIPRIQFDAVALEGDDDKTLRRAIGHIPGTSYPDASGTAAFAGHRDTFFRRLGELRQNDLIVFESGNHTYRYRVASTSVVDPDDTYVLRSTDGPALKLVTCYPFYFVGPAPKRFVVTALRIPEASEASPHDQSEKLVHVAESP